MNPVYYRLRQATLLLATLYSSSALGAIIMVTDAGFPGGANNVTRDLGTGLDWLDWTASTNISFDSMTPLLGTTYQGWSHASQAQVTTLMSNFGVPVASYPGLSVLNDGGTSATSFLNFFGATKTSHATLGLTSSVPSVGFHTIAVIDVTPTQSRSSTAAASLSCDTCVSVTVGHALVRPVPEPSTFVLAALGLVGLLALQRKEG